MPAENNNLRWSKVVNVETKLGELQPIELTKEHAYAMFEALDLYIEESSGMCQQTDDCWSGSGYGKKPFVTKDYQVFSHYKCDNCGTIIISTHLTDYINHEEMNRIVQMHDEEPESNWH